MKNKIFIIILVMLCNISIVNALNVNIENSEIIIDGTIIYQKGVKTNNIVEGITFDEENMIIIIDSSFSPKTDGIKIIEVPIETMILYNEDISFSLENRYGINILNSNVVISSNNNSILTLDNKGIQVSGVSNLYLDNIIINAEGIFYDNGKVIIYNNVAMNNTKLYENNKEISIKYAEIGTLEGDLVIEEEPQKEDNNGILLYILIASFFIVCALVVLFVKAKEQRNIKKVK